MKKIIAVLLILSLIPVSGLIGKTENDVGLMAKETEGVKKKSHTFGKILLWTLAAAAVGTVVYFTVIKKPEYKLTVEVGNGVEGSPAAGVYKYKKGSTVSYDFRKLAGYGSLNVTLDGSLVASSGSIVMDKEHNLLATALEVGNYTSIKLRIRFYLKTLNVKTGVTGVAIRDENKKVLSLIASQKTIKNTCSPFLYSNMNCNDAINDYENTIDFSLESKNFFHVYQDFIAFFCDSNREDVKPLICTFFEFTILEYSWEQNKANPGFPVIENLDKLVIIPDKDYQIAGGAVGIRKDERIDFVRPSNPQAAAGVFTVGCL